MEPLRNIDVTPLTAEIGCRRCGKLVIVSSVRTPLTGQWLLPEWVTCPTCEAEATALIQAEDEARRQAAAEARRSKLLADLDVPPDFAWATRVDEIAADWGTDAQRTRTAAAISIARRIVMEMTRGLKPPLFCVFSGRPGNGKSLLTWAIAHELAGVHGRSARVVRLSSMVRDLREAWSSRTGPGEGARLARYTRPDFLGIDEVSRGAFYGRPQQHLSDVITIRIEQHRPTVITTNEDLEGLEAILGPALMSRLAMGGRIHFGDDEDRRQWSARERSQGGRKQNV